MSEPSKPGTRGRTPDRTRRRADPERLPFVEAMRVAVYVALLTWPSFTLLDAFNTYVVAPAAPLAPLLIARFVEQLLIVVAYLLLRAPIASPSTLPSPLRVAAAEALVFVGASVTIAVMALYLGGLRSNYVHGISIVVLVRGAAVPSRWQRTALVCGCAALSFPLVMFAAATFHPSLAAQWSTRANVAGFIADYIFVLSTVMLASASSHIVWAARRAARASRKLGRYVLKARIGVGGMGEVWLARDDALNRNVALKMLQGRDSDDAVARFEREAHATSSLRDPHSVKVFDFGSDDDGTWFIAMEHLIGADLDLLVEEHGPLSAPRAARIVRQACESLTEAHETGIVHRDIKPANLFLTRVGDDYDFVKLLDFGIAKVASQNGAVTELGVVGGTPRYMAPELWAGGAADARSDVYSLGCTLYFLLTGRPPFDAESLSGLAAAHAVQDVGPPSGDPTGPSSFDEIVLRCMAKAPDDRFQSMRALREAIEACSFTTTWTAEDARAFWTVTRPQTHDRHFSTRPPPGTGTTLDIPLAPRVPTARGLGRLTVRQRRAGLPGASDDGGPS